MVLIPLIYAAIITAAAHGYIKYLQLNNYKVIKAAKNFLKKQSASLIVLSVLSAVCLCLLIFGDGVSELYIYAAYCAAVLIFTLPYNAAMRKKAKTPLVFTKRVKRLFAFLYITNALMFFLIYELFGIKIYMIAATLLTLPNIADYAFFAAAINVLERANNGRYVKRAQKKLSSCKNLIKIGITGSYAKTSVKNILQAMLATKYKTAATEKNFNTPLGIARSVESLDGTEEIFIAEMGARRKGEIKELCDIVKPDIGIISGITMQHTETFKSLDNIIETKSELFYALPDGGMCVFNADDAEIRGLDILKEPKSLTAGTSDTFGCYAQDIVSDINGSGFTLCFAARSGGNGNGAAKSKKIAVKTQLIGRANIVNITVAAAAAYYLGVGLSDIRAAIGDLKPVPHRCEIIKNENTSVTVIDDAYNSNPVGAAAALDTLKMFDGRKIVVTCGFAEQGKNIGAANGAFGRLIAESADIAVLIGADGKYIREGLMSVGFDAENILSYPSLAAAKKDFNVIFESGDVVLFENDMPDNME
ncbi:MAG: UDP-N-acetylmuramoyl-tripeptide--D-alanyl-D-alanine ligase [Clostridiales bacterium]|jgi:UDP-N-acetylmuramoyl-tripeptide--D-alanyl-D-alanine ligase|nr:UDP-N-acetylmuramoyl-tripeptide--D-alanyl-D-alanine ligase [Clostridiales bacterium]